MVIWLSEMSIEVKDVVRIPRNCTVVGWSLGEFVPSNSGREEHRVIADPRHLAESQISKYSMK